MDKIQPIGKGWSAEGALHSALELIKGKPNAQILVLIREDNNYCANFRAGGVTNAEAGFLADEFKHDLFNRCHECKCQQSEE